MENESIVPEVETLADCPPLSKVNHNAGLERYVVSALQEKDRQCGILERFSAVDQENGCLRVEPELGCADSANPTALGGEPPGLPINMRLHRKKEKTLIKMAVEMIREKHSWLSERTIVVFGDGFYATLAGKPLDAVKIITRISRDANRYDLLPKRESRRGWGRPRTK